MLKKVTAFGDTASKCDMKAEKMILRIIHFAVQSNVQFSVLILVQQIQQSVLLPEGKIQRQSN